MTRAATTLRPGQSGRETAERSTTARHIARASSRQPAGRWATAAVLGLLVAALASCSSASSTDCNDYLSLSPSAQEDLIDRAVRQRNRILLEPTSRAAVDVDQLCRMGAVTTVGDGLGRIGIPDSSSPLDRNQPLFWILVLGALGVGALWRQRNQSDPGAAQQSSGPAASRPTATTHTASATRQLDPADRSLLAQASGLDEPAPSILEFVIEKDRFHRRLTVDQLAREFRRPLDQVHAAVEALESQRLVRIDEQGRVFKGSG